MKIYVTKAEGSSFAFISIKNEQVLNSDIQKIFQNSLLPLPEDDKKFLIRSYLPGVSNPVAESLARVLKVHSKDIRVDLALEFTQNLNTEKLKELEALWKEPAIERLESRTFKDYLKWLENLKIPSREDPSFLPTTPAAIGLEFSPEELSVLQSAEEKQSRQWNRAEWELFAQTWSEHCKHKIFNAEIHLTKEGVSTSSIFKNKLRTPALKIAEEKKNLYLSLFHDNAGVLRIFTPDQKASSWGIAAKMETHNSPSAISPYGGASTGIVGVHRDILGTGLGALPIANWDVLCFEEPQHSESRPEKALAPEIIRKGVLKGIQDGGNQSGIPTVQGSTIFDPSYAVKPLVFAGSLGICPTDFVNKKAKCGDTLFVIGGATGADGLRGAVMSSRDIRSEDFAGSIVQVANPYTQRCLTDFLIEARDKGLLSAVTDNGAGGLASSVGEMSTLTGGAEIDLTHVRLKFEGLHAWEKLLSESQERMTLATHDPKGLIELLKSWRIEYDQLGVLNNSGRFVVFHDQSGKKEKLVDVSLQLLHDQCPKLKLSTEWTFEDEKKSVASSISTPIVASHKLTQDFIETLSSSHETSREAICRRFDHEVQGRTLKKPFGGLTQESPQDGSLIEVMEASSYVALGHGLAPKEKDFYLSLLLSFDEAVKKYLLATGQLQYAGLLDNYSWPDPLQNDRSLWKLYTSGEILETISYVTKIPFVSGKDSMKNNDSQHRILETLVISIFGSALGPEHMPTGFITEEGAKIYNWKSIEGSILAHSNNFSSALDLTRATLQKLYSRYQLVEKWIQEKKLICAKDFSALCPLKSLFEMCLGRKKGIHFNDNISYKELAAHTSSLGGFHFIFTADFDFEKEIPHHLKEEIIEIGQTNSTFSFVFKDQEQNLETFRKAYHQESEQLWA